MARSWFPHVRNLHVRQSRSSMGKHETFTILASIELISPQAMSLLGFLTLALFPVPILFFFYGSKIRKMSRFTT